MGDWRRVGVGRGKDRSRSVVLGFLSSGTVAGGQVVPQGLGQLSPVSGVVTSSPRQ